MTAAARHLLVCTAVLAVGIAVVAAAGSPAAAEAAWTIRGKGFGHGVGMSQHGAEGRARNGRNFRQILRHYYTGVRIGAVKQRQVKVLLATKRRVRFRRAKHACGRRVNPAQPFIFAGTNRVRLMRPNGRVVRRCGRQGRATGPGGVRIAGRGRYRGALIARATGSTLMVINRVGIEGYVKGVVPNEMPSSWRQQALRAQAVAARSFGLATSRSGAFDHYADTRSQVYGGRSSETKPTNRAVNQTRRKVIRHNGKVAVAYYHSTSGGQTENVEHGFGGGSPSPYLKSVNDNPDRISPVHSWRVTYTNAQMRSRLGGLFQGNLRRIRILKTGVSPRIVRARVVGSEGSSVVSGETLRFRLGLRSTWARFERN